ncbi:MAG: DUF5615 family PIN-like protein [Phormidesmis sp.]
MRILLDECVPRPLKRELAGYDVRTVVEMGWAGTKNGALLERMSAEGFTILLTADQNLRYEQNLKQANVAVVVLVAPSNRLSDLVPLMAEARKVLSNIAPGEVIEV